MLKKVFESDHCSFEGKNCIQYFLTLRGPKTDNRKNQWNCKNSKEERKQLSYQRMICVFFPTKYKEKRKNPPRSYYWLNARISGNLNLHAHKTSHRAVPQQFDACHYLLKNLSLKLSQREKITKTSLWERDTSFSRRIFRFVKWRMKSYCTMSFVPSRTLVFIGETETLK